MWTDLLLHAHWLPAAIVVLTVLVGVAVAALADRDLCTDILKALARAGWKLDAAACSIGISSARLSKQLNGHDPLTALSRLLALEGVHAAFVEVSAPRYGIVVVPNQELADILSCLRGNKRMQKMALREGSDEAAAS